MNRHPKNTPRHRSASRCARSRCSGRCSELARTGAAGHHRRMTDPFADLLKPNNLHALKSIGYHLANTAREKGEDSSKPLAFVGLITIAIGATMLLKAVEKGRGR